MGWKWSEEQRKRKSDMMKKYFQEYPEVVKKHSEKLKEFWGSSEARKCQSERIRKYFSEHPEARKAMSRRNKEFANRPEVKEAFRKRIKEFLNRPEVKKANRERAKERWRNPELRKLQSERMMEISNRPETKKAFATRMEKYYKNPEWKNPRALGKTWKRSEEAKKHFEEMINHPEMKKQLSKRAIEWWLNNPEEKERKRRMMKERYQDSEERRLQSKRMKEICNHPEAKERVSAQSKKYWASLSYEKKLAITFPSRMAVKFISKPHLALFNNVKQHYPEAECHRYIIKTECDIILREFKINIEYDGAYWHKNPEKDEVRDKALRKLGWTILRVKEGEPFDINVLHDLVKNRKSNAA